MAFNKQIKKQIEKDAHILRNDPECKGITWHFSPGNQGEPDKRVIRHLREEGVDVGFHDFLDASRTVSKLFEVGSKVAECLQWLQNHWSSLLLMMVGMIIFSMLGAPFLEMMGETKPARHVHGKDDDLSSHGDEEEEDEEEEDHGNNEEEEKDDEEEDYGNNEEEEEDDEEEDYGNNEEEEEDDEEEYYGNNEEEEEDDEDGSQYGNHQEKHTEEEPR